jgi:hypothetical protein
MLAVLGGLADVERDLIRTRTAEGRSRAKARGQPMAPWVAEYLHEITVFPNGKHDDQVDSTAQFLDWYKKPFVGQNIFELYRRDWEADQQRRKPQPTQTTWAIGSMEWFAEQKKSR